MGSLLAQRLADSRLRAGLTQEQLATALGPRYSQEMISHVERGRSAMLLDGVVRAARVLNTSLDYLVGITDEPLPLGRTARAGITAIPASAALAETMGRRLKASREAAGYSPAEMAARLGGGCTVAQIELVDAGKLELLCSGVVTAAGILGVSVDYLLGLTDDPVPAGCRRAED